MFPKAWRIVPSAFVVGLLVLVVRAQPPCDPPSRFEIPGTATFVPPAPVDDLQIMQPLPITDTVEYPSAFRASLGPVSPLAHATLDIGFRDPDNSPATITAMLSHRFVTASALTSDTDFEMTRPLVVRAVTGTAQTLDFEPAIFVRLQDSEGTPAFRYEPDAATVVAAMVVSSSNGTIQVPGANPVLAWSACLNPASDLYVLQQVVTLESPPLVLFGEAEIAQEFTVPTTATAQWIELVSRSENGNPPSDLDIEIIEIQGSYALEYESHPATITATRLHAADQGSFDQARWIASDPFDFRPWLLPGRTYVVRIRITPSDGLPGGSGVAFLGAAVEDAMPGALYTRYVPSDPPFTLPSDLAFRLIGTVGLDDRTPSVPTCTAATIEVATPTATIAEARLAQVYVDALHRPLGAASHVVCDCATVTAELRLRGDDGPVRSDTYALEPDVRTYTVEDGWTQRSFTRPLVTTCVTGTVETNLPGLTFDFRGATGTATILGVTLRGTTQTSQLLFREGLAGWEPIPDVTASAVLCGVVEPDGSDGSLLRVLQQVVTVTDPAPGSDFILVPTATAQLVQYFTCPVTSTAEWVEFAVGGLAQPAPPLQVRLYDAAVIGIPPQAPLPVTETAVFAPANVTESASWLATNRFPVTTMLEPGHTYALVVDTQHAWTLGTTNTTETADGLFRSDTGGFPYEADPNFTLSFRLIGIPADTATDVQPITLPSTFALHVGPNPASTRFALSWMGGVGRVSVDIADVRGRRLLQVRDAGLAQSGQWIWDGRDSHGRQLPTGIYFVRIRDARGQMATERVVLLR